MNKEIDVRDVLPTVRVPALVLHGSDDQIVPIEVGIYGASGSAGALCRVPGVGHLASAAARAERIGVELKDFLDDVRRDGSGRKSRRSACLPPSCSPTRRLDQQGDRTRRQTWRELLERHNAGRAPRAAAIPRPRGRQRRGRVLRNVRRARPRSALRICDRRRSTRTRTSTPSGPAHRRVRGVDGKVAGIAVHTGARVAAHASAGEVLVSSTVRDLVAGSDIPFVERGTHELKGIPGEWRLFALQNDSVPCLALFAIHHRVREIRNMARSFPYTRVHQNRRVNSFNVVTQRH